MQAVTTVLYDMHRLTLQGGRWDCAGLELLDGERQPILVHGAPIFNVVLESLIKGLQATFQRGDTENKAVTFWHDQQCHCVTGYLFANPFCGTYPTIQIFFSPNVQFIPEKYFNNELVRGTQSITIWESFNKSELVIGPNPHVHVPFKKALWNFQCELNRTTFGQDPEDDRAPSSDEELVFDDQPPVELPNHRRGTLSGGKGAWGWS